MATADSKVKQNENISSWGCPSNVGSTVTPLTIISMLSCTVPSMTKDDQEYLSKFKLSCDYKKKKQNMETVMT